jgi:hypothetical protein
MKIQPIDRPIRYTITGLDAPISDITIVGNLTGVNPALSVVADADPLAYVAALGAIAAQFPALPDSGWLEQDSIYQYAGGAVIVRQSHYRTIYAPADTPALFIVYREGAAGVLEWVAGESVLVGTRRTYDGIEYECVQAHTTQSDWTPPTVPALWRAVVEPTAEWTAGVYYAIGAVVAYQGALYECRQAHTAQVGWEPPKVLALWLPL